MPSYPSLFFCFHLFLFSRHWVRARVRVNIKFFGQISKIYRKMWSQERRSSSRNLRSPVVESSGTSNDQSLHQTQPSSRSTGIRTNQVHTHTYISVILLLLLPFYLTQAFHHVFIHMHVHAIFAIAFDIFFFLYSW